MPINTWAHVVVTNSVSLESNSLRVYLNGKLQTDALTSRTVEEYGSADFWKGEDKAFTGQLGGAAVMKGFMTLKPFAGKVDDLLFYTSALDQESIKALWLRVDAQPTSAVVAYNFEEMNVLSSNLVVDTCVAEDGFDYQGHTLSEVAAKDAAECCTLCGTSLECMVWSFHKSSQSCHL